MANDAVVDQGRRRFLTATTSVVGGAGVVLAAIPWSTTASFAISTPEGCAIVQDRKTTKHAQPPRREAFALRTTGKSC